MKYLLYITVLLSFTPAFGQDQLRLRLGYPTSFASGKDADLHTTTGYRLTEPSIIGLEYYKPIPGKKANYLFGAFFEAQAYAGGINPKKFQVNHQLGYLSSSDYASIKLYVGYERSISKRKRLNSNYFSVMGGVSLNINATKGGVSYSLMGGAEELMETLNGDIYGSPYSDVKERYHSVLGLKRANLITPGVFGGLRWNIVNRRGDPVFILEAVANYSLLPKMYIEFPYTLNGVPKTDRIKDFGLNVELNAIVPLKTFGKKKRE